ncbi:hypothetical protein ACF065_31995 [Streptomyces sp. NPDC015232]|uniref:Uncharacterized protein n=2 Tax=Streptomyces TaxID=1883 RepID=G2GA08_9ACTN|nr:MULTISPECIES: hypothetical protein [Streptomyces]EGX59719.1 hypothetical protein SZN_11643 [Streptomyces zinciresistens K42]MBQ0976483.1 hypothetical protein [Streptomyces sp. RK31]
MNKLVIGRTAGIVLGLLLGLAALAVPAYALYALHTEGMSGLSAVIGSHPGCR